MSVLVQKILLTSGRLLCPSLPKSSLAFAGLNALVFHSTVYRKVDQWDREEVTPLRARLAGALGILLWFTVIAAGRWQAYQ